MATHIWKVLYWARTLHQYLEMAFTWLFDQMKNPWELGSQLAYCFLAKITAARKQSSQKKFKPTWAQLLLSSWGCQCSNWKCLLQDPENSDSLTLGYGAPRHTKTRIAKVSPQSLGKWEQAISCDFVLFAFFFQYEWFLPVASSFPAFCEVFCGIKIPPPRGRRK